MRAEDLVKLAKEKKDLEDERRRLDNERLEKEAQKWFEENKDKVLNEVVRDFLSRNSEKHSVDVPTPKIGQKIVDMFTELGYKALNKEDLCPMSGWTSFYVVVWNPIRSEK
jgi:hypothetical protein